MSPPAKAASIGVPADPQRQALLPLVDALDAPSLHWLAGYATGRALSLSPDSNAAVAGAASSGVVALASAVTLTVLYGSQTGNARRIAEALASAAEATGHGVRLLRADRYNLRELSQERLIYIAISTQGDGDPPDDALRLLEELTSRRAPRLDDVGFAVFALGDSSYPQFCVVGRRLDARLAELGAQRVLPLVEADLDFEPVAKEWQGRAIETAAKRLAPIGPKATVTALRPVPATPAIDHAPLVAEVVVNQRITARDSHRDVRHVELVVPAGSLDYLPGDALAVWPENPADTVQAIIACLELDADGVVDHQGRRLPLQRWLTEHCELTRLSRPLIAAHADRSPDPRLQALLAPERAEALALWLRGHQLIDLLREYPATWSASELVAALRPLAPRPYSIASSRHQVGDDEVHLTVAHVAYEHEGQPRWGAASHWLAGRAEGQTVRVRIERNERFRLPSDGDRDLIMIGPGTGIAPFRAFLQERIASGATGRHWLFFGDRHLRRDFLYQLEWQQALRDGHLHELDLAFSRDQSERIHVQHRLRERGRVLYDWLQGGAHLYVCGGIAMARDVHQALIGIFAEHAGTDAQAAEQQLHQAMTDGRYARDVY